VAIALLPSTAIHAQTFFGSIVGTVSDAGGAVISDATVTATNLGTNETKTVKTDAAGNYRFVNLVPADYKVDVMAKNFKRFVRERLNVAVNITTRQDAALQVGAATETVEVTTQVPLLQTDSGTISTQVEGTTVTEMPLNGRNSMNLIALAAGVVPQGSTSGGTGMNMTNTGHTQNAAWNNYQIGGSLAGESSLYTDGAPDNTLGGSFAGNQVALVLAQDSVQEFNVASNNMTADFGRNGGAVVNMATKGGTNQINGSVYEYLRNSFFNANEWFNKQAQTLQGTPNKPLKWNQNQYGLAVGGPVLKNKLFFHFNWEGFKVSSASPQPGLVPTAAQQAGDIPASIYDPGQASFNVNGQTITNNFAPFSTCSLVPDGNGGTLIKNLGSAGCGDTMALAIKGYYPSPTPNYNVSGNNYYIAPVTTDTQNQYTGRVDYTTGNQRIFARYTYWSLRDSGQSLLGNHGGWLTQNSAASNFSQQAVVGDTYTFSAKTVLDVRLSYLRDYAPNSIPASLGTDYAKTPTSLSGTYLGNLSSQLAYHMLPSFGISGQGPTAYSMLSVGRISQYNVDFYNTYALAASLIRIQGNHTLKIGGEVRMMDNTDLGAGMNAVNSGSFNFSGNFTGDPWADFLLGYVKGGQGFGAGGSIQLSNSVTAYNYYQAYYATDTWQAARNLTLTLGLRWELPGGIYSKHGLNTVLLPNYQWASNGVDFTGALGLVNQTMPDGNTKVAASSLDIKHDLFAPRIGFAYRVGSNSAIRGGYGISYLSPDTQIGVLPSQSPVNGHSTSCGSTASQALNPFQSVAFPDPTQLMFNCFGTMSWTLGNTTYHSNNPLIPPPGVSYNGGNLVSYLGDIGNTQNSVKGAVPGQKFPYVQQWNLSVSHSMKGDLMFEIGYAASKGTHMPGLGSNYNQIPDSVWMGQSSTALAALKTNATTTNSNCSAGEIALWNSMNPASPINVGQCARPYHMYGNVSDTLDYVASTIYHSLQIKTEKRFHSGGTLMANYTWSKTIGDTDSSVASNLEYGSGVNGPSGGGVQDYDRPQDERSVLQHDVPQRAVISYVLALPFGKGQKWGNNTNSMVSHAISGWGLNGITTFQKGFHLAIGDQASNFGSSTNGDLSNFGFGSLRPMYTAGCNKMEGITGSYSSRVKTQMPQFNINCFTQPADYQLGTEKRVDSNLFAQGIMNFDFSAMKTTKITERTSLQFRAEFFNLFNRTQFAPPAATLGQTGAGNLNEFGLIFQTAAQPRLVQFSMRVNF
jgi:hypothetical protein